MASTAQKSQNIPTMTLDMQISWVLLGLTGIIITFLMFQYRSLRRDWRKRNNYRTAIRLLDRMIEVDPTNALAVWQKGETYEAMGMHDHALRFYRRAHEMCPRAYAYHNISDAYDRLKGNLKLRQTLRTPSLN